MSTYEPESQILPPPDVVLDAIQHGEVLYDQGPVTTTKIKFRGQNAVVKYGRNVRQSEALAMAFVHDHAPSIPVPQVLATYQAQPSEPGEPCTNYIVTEWVDGQGLDDVWPSLSERDKDDIFQQLRSIIQTLRQLSPPDCSYYIGAVGYMPCTDPIIFDQGPFKDISAFNAALTEIARPFFRWNWLSIVQRSLARTDAYRIVFTHGDLHISNILVQRATVSSESHAGDTQAYQWRIGAVIDWECAGWYPEHWEYVKILSGVKWKSDWAARAQDLLERHYDEEFLLDNRLRMHLRI